MPCIILLTKVVILGYPVVVFTICLIFLYTVATWLHLLKKRRNQLNGRGQCVASCGVWQAFAVSWLCALCVPFLSKRSHQGGDRPPDTGKLWLRREDIRRHKSFLLLLENLAKSSWWTEGFFGCNPKSPKYLLLLLIIQRSTQTEFTSAKDTVSTHLYFHKLPA